MADFVVSGKLQLSAGAFVSEAQKAATALRGVESASRSLGSSATAVTAGTAREATALDAAAAAAQRYKAQVQLGQQLNLQLSSSTAQLTQQLAGQARAEDAAAAARARLNAALGATPKPGATPPAPKPAPALAPTPTPPSTPAGLTAQQKLMLGYQLNDVFTQAASGGNPLMIAAQQGPQITQIFGGVRNTVTAAASAIRAIPPVALAAGAALATLAAPLAIGASRAEEMAQQQRQLSITLAATGNAAGKTARDLQQLSDQQARRAGAGREETFQGLQTVLSQPAISGQNIDRTLALSRDLARVMGSDLPGAAQVYAQALDGTVASARKLDQAFNVLTAAELEQIRLYEEQGRRGEAVTIMLGALERRHKGLNEQGLSPTKRAFGELGKAWEDFSNALANSWLVRNGVAVFHAIAQAAAGVGKAVVQAGTWVLGGVPADAAQAVAKGREALEEEERRLADLEKRRSQAIKPLNLEQLIASSRRKIEQLKATLGELEKSADVVAHDKLAGAGEAAQREADERIKSTLDQLDRIGTVAKQKRATQAEIDRLLEAQKAPNLSPETAKQIDERLRTLQGNLRGLRTAGEEAQRGLDLEGVLAKLPAHLRESTRAYLETKRAALEAGDSQVEAERKAEQARRNVATQRATDTRQQVENLSAEARAALAVAEAYGKGQAEAYRVAAEQRARLAETQGSIAPGTAGQVAAEELRQQAAAQVAAAAEKNYAYRLEVEALERVAVAEGISAEAAREAERANKVAAVAAELRAYAAASGSETIAAAAEKEIAAYDRLTRRQFATDQRREANAINRQFDPAVAYAQTIAQLQALEAQGLLTARALEEGMKQANLRWLESSRNAIDGAILGFKRYADEATNAGTAAAEGVRKSMSALEDGIVQFTTTGKISFTGMVNSWIADISRMITRQFITGPLGQLAGGLLERLFGGGGGLGGFGNDNTVTGTRLHAGGIVGRDGAVGAGVPAIAWLGARRFHGGGLVGFKPGERPIIAMDEEEVLTRDDPRHRFNLGRGAGPAVQVTVINNAQAQVGVRERTNADGTIGIDVIIEQLEGRLANNLVRGNSQLGEAIEGTYGAQRLGRRM